MTLSSGKRHCRRHSHTQQTACLPVLSQHCPYCSSLPVACTAVPVMLCLSCCACHAVPVIAGSADRRQVLHSLTVGLSADRKAGSGCPGHLTTVTKGDLQRCASCTALKDACALLHVFLNQQAMGICLQGRFLNMQWSRLSTLLCTTLCMTVMICSMQLTRFVSSKCMRTGLHVFRSQQAICICSSACGADC